MEINRAPSKLSQIQKGFGIVYKGLPFFINETSDTLSDTVEMFELPVRGLEISVSVHFLLISTRDSLRIYKYNENFTLKLKAVIECSYVLFMKRLLSRGARALVYKVILTLFEQKTTSEHLLKRHLRAINEYLKIELIKSTEFIGNTVKIYYRCGKTFYFNNFFNLVEAVKSSGDILRVVDRRMEVSRNGSLIVSKSVGNILQCDRIGSLAFLLTETSIIVAQFGRAN